MAEIYVPILTYHRIVEGTGGNLAVTPSEFAHQMKGLVEQGYVGVPLADAVAARAGRLSGQAGGRGGAWKSYKAFAVTFDHGYADNFRNAFPILKEFGITAHFFLVTEFVDTQKLLPLPGNPNTDAARDRLMTWDEAMQLKEAGMGIGAMTANHVDLASVDAATAADEINQSRDAIRGFLGDDPSYFSYPFSKLTPPLKEMVREAGFRGAVYTPTGKTGGLDRFSLRRIGIEPGLSQKAFAFKVSEQADLLRENPAKYALMKAMGKAY